MLSILNVLKLGAFALTFILRNTRVEAIQDLSDSWPDRLDLTGFIYGQLGGLSLKPLESLADRDIDWILNWLEKDPMSSPGRYGQLARILKTTGYQTKANEVLYAGRVKEHQTAAGGNCLWLWVTWAIIGYGYRINYTIGWILCFVGFGSWVASRSAEIRDCESVGYVEYSLDMLIPVVRLRELHHSAIDLQTPWQRRYFYIHQLMGYVLASFLIAHFSGLIRFPVDRCTFAFLLRQAQDERVPPWAKHFPFTLSSSKGERHGHEWIVINKKPYHTLRIGSRANPHS